jgi:hypothetical protein
MPSVVQTQTLSSVAYMLKEKVGEPLVSTFTAVNGRTSPQSPRKLNGMHGMTNDTIHVRPISQPQPEQPQDQKLPLPTREEWTSGPRPAENGLHKGHYSVSPSSDGRDLSPNSPGKRKRASSSEDDQSYHSPEGAPVQARRRVDTYPPASRDHSPNTVTPSHPGTMEQPQQRTLPPIDRAEHDRNWPPREGQDPNPHYPDPRAIGPSQEGMNPHPVAHMNGSMDPQYSMERSSTMETTRAGAQVDPKKRKRVSPSVSSLPCSSANSCQQFANRTKTGCGTCRRRKKKCDEAKPECVFLHPVPFACC